MSTRVVLGGASILLAMGVVAATFYLFQAGKDPNLDLGPVGAIPNRVQTGPDRDVPCSESEGKAPVCATPLPALTASESKMGVPLELDTITIPLDHRGSYRVLLGQATLPRGVIERMSFAVDNAGSGQFVATVFYLELEDAETKAILPTNVYEKGMVPGAQRVNAYLRFELESFTLGASVKATNIDVR